MTWRDWERAGLRAGQEAGERLTLWAYVNLEATGYYGRRAVRLGGRRLRVVVRWTLAWLGWAALALLWTMGRGGVFLEGEVLRACLLVGGLIFIMLRIRGGWQAQRQQERARTWRW